MEKASEIRKLLRLTQQDMAMLLGVSRSHYSMYESGKRGLPLPAMQTLSEFFAHAQLADMKGKATAVKEVKQRQGKELRLIRQLLHENEYQQKLLTRKISQMVKKQQTDSKRQFMIGCMEGKAAGANEEDTKMRAVLAKASKATHEDVNGQLLKFQIRQDVLVFERSLLEEKLQAAGREGKPSPKT